MSEIKVLTLLEIRSLYGINKYLHTKDKKEKNRYKLLGCSWILVICMVVFYVAGLAYGLCRLGLSDIVPAYLVVIASLLIIVFGFFKAGNAIFGTKGYDIISSMPVKSGSIVVSRFLAMYVEELIFAFAIMLPGTLTYGICQHPPIGFYIVAFLGTLFIPAIPLVVSTLVGTLIMAISSGMKQKSIIQTVLMVLLMIAILVGSFSMQNFEGEFDIERFSQLASTIGELIGKIYVPAVWLGDAMVHMNIMKLLLFIFLSIALITLMIYFVSKNFHTIVHRLLNFTAKHNYKIGTMESRSLIKALYLREAKRYFSSSVYVTNTIIGPIMGTIISVALCVIGMGTFQNVLSVPIDISGIIPFAISAVFCMMTTTSTAISMEGKQFEVIKSLPIPTKQLLDSKILLNLSLMLPFFLLSEVALVIAIKPDFIELVWLLIIPMLLILFAVVFGITVNLKFHSFDWEKEEAVVKQSLSSMLGGFSGMIISILLGGAVFFLPMQYGNIAKSVVCLMLLFCIVLLYRKNNTAELEKL